MNPNSLHSVALVLQKLRKDNGAVRSIQAETSDEHERARHWTFVTCDGRPYVLYQKLLEAYVVCCICNKEIYRVVFSTVSK